MIADNKLNNTMNNISSKEILSKFENSFREFVNSLKEREVTFVCRNGNGSYYVNAWFADEYFKGADGFSGEDLFTGTIKSVDIVTGDDGFQLEVTAVNSMGAARTAFIDFSTFNIK